MPGGRAEQQQVYVPDAAKHFAWIEEAAAVLVEFENDTDIP